MKRLSDGRFVAFEVAALPERKFPADNPHGMLCRKGKSKDIFGGFMSENLKVETPAPELSGNVTVKSCHGKYLSAESNGDVVCNRDVAKEWEIFLVESPFGSTIVALKSCHNNYLSAQPDGTLQWNRNEKSEWETWTVEPTAKGFAFKSFHGKYLSALPGGSVVADRAKAQEWETFTVNKS